MNFFSSLAIFSAIGITTGGMATAQQRVNAFDDWAVYTADSPKECWIVSNAAEVLNTRGGKKVKVNRGDILLWVTYLPTKGVAGEVSFSGGYPFKPGQAVKLSIGASAYDMVPDGEHAWPASKEMDQKIRVSMTKGAKAIISAESSRGTKTKDTFSLKGFTAALNDAKKRCS